MSDEPSPLMGPEALDPRAIEREIAKIRERESNPYLTGIRTNLFNLVIFKTPAAAGGVDSVSGALGHLLGKRPARIITIEPGDGPESSVYVSGRCFPDIRNRGVCFEEIRIAGGADRLGTDLGTWSPLLIRDLPVFVWWVERLSPPSPLLIQAVGLIDKLIVDTAQCVSLGEDPLVALGQLADLRQRSRGSLVVSDLAWKRIHALRVNAARLFNPEKVRPMLAEISRVALAGGTRAEALLFFLWLAGRLGWKAGELHDAPMPFVDVSGRRVEAAHTEEGPLSDGFRLVFSFAGDKGELSVDCGRNGCVTVGEEKGLYRFLADGEALMEEVDSLKQDAMFLEAIAAASAPGQREPIG